VEDFLKKSWDHLMGRIDGPMWIRLIIQPLVSLILGLRAGVRDAGEHLPPFGWSLCSDHARRGTLLKQAWRDIARLFTVAVAIDLIYQLSFLRALHPLQALLVASVLALLPYALVRGPTNRVIRMRQFHLKKTVSSSRKTA
jgi:hypothetical protein